MTEITDAWMQFPNEAYLLNPMFDSLRRWPTNWKSLAENNPAIRHDQVLAEFRDQGVKQVITSAWWGPSGPMNTNVAHEFPELRIVGGHIGFPWVSEMISVMMKHPNVFVDTSAYKASRFPQELIAYMRGPGKRR
jgi:hypothetical protein